LPDPEKTKSQKSGTIVGVPEGEGKFWRVGWAMDLDFWFFRETIMRRNLKKIEIIDISKN
jgi:hypothetical protein